MTLVRDNYNIYQLIRSLKYGRRKLKAHRDWKKVKETSCFQDENRMEEKGV